MKAGRIIFVLMLAFATVAVPLSAYVTGYVALGEYRDYRGNTAEGEPTNQVVRNYRDKQWCLSLFAPAAAVESKWIGVPVYLSYSVVPPPPLVVYDTYIDDSAPPE